MAKASFSKVTTRITVDGKTYASVEEMPADVRREYEETIGRLLADRDGNGVPDVFESGTVEGADVARVTTTSEVYEINGRRYDSLDDVPPEFREMLAPSRGLHIHLRWGTVAWLAAGLALAAWVAYLVWDAVSATDR